MLHLLKVSKSEFREYEGDKDGVCWPVQICGQSYTTPFQSELQSPRVGDSTDPALASQEPSTETEQTKGKILLSNHQHTAWCACLPSIARWS